MTTNYSPETGNPWGRRKSESAQIRLFEPIFDGESIYELN
jgi:hypothetical protein